MLKENPKAHSFIFMDACAFFYFFGYIEKILGGLQMKFWLNDPLHHLKQAYKSKTIIPALVTKVEELNGKEVAFLNLGDGFKGLCTEDEFDVHSYRSLGGFVGHQIDVLITSMDQSNDYIICSRRLAAEQKKTKTLQKIEVGQVYNGKVSGMNHEKGTIFIDIGGVDGFCYQSDWDYETLENQLDFITLGEPVTVVVTSIIQPEASGDEQEQPNEFQQSNVPIIRLSRKACMKDPWNDFLENYKVGDFIPGSIVDVSRQHGIFVKVKKGVTIKGEVPNHFGNVVPGEYVVGRLSNLSPEKKHGKMIITNFPHGRKKNENFASYLFD